MPICFYSVSNVGYLDFRDHWYVLGGYLRGGEESLPIGVQMAQESNAAGAHIQ